jgi:hypothetical protein
LNETNLTSPQGIEFRRTNSRRTSMPNLTLIKVYREEISKKLNSRQMFNGSSMINEFKLFSLKSWGRSKDIEKEQKI